MATQFITAEFDGQSSQTIDLFSPDTYVMPFTGTGGLSIDLFQTDFSAEFDGVGGWIESDIQIDQIGAAWSGVGGWIESDVQVDQIKAAWSGAGSLLCDLYELNINNVDYAAEDGTTLYVAEDGTTQYTTEWAPATNVFYVTENGIDNYVIEGTLEDYTTEDGLTNYTTEDGVQPYYSLGASGFLWDYVPENYQQATQFIFAQDWLGVGGFNCRVTYLDSVKAKFSGVGGWTVDVVVHPIRQPITATWDGVGGWQININTVPARQDIEAEFDGTGGWTANPLQLDQIAAEFDGVGGLSLELITQQALINAAWHGAGNWTADVLEIGQRGPPITVAWAGVGNWIADVLEIGQRGPPITATFAGVGGWFANPLFISITSISAVFAGVGGLSIGSLTRIAAPGELPANFCLLDPVWRRLYNDTMEVGQPTTLLFNVGIPVHNPLLTITRPDGSSYQAASVLVGKQTFPSEIYFGPTPYPSFQANQYVVYGFGLNELNQAGTWSVTLQSSAVTVTMAFKVYLLGTSLLAA